MTTDEGADDTPEKVTMLDLWRHISGLKGEMRGVETRLTAEVTAVRDDLKGDIEAAVAKLTDEANIIRNDLSHLAAHEDIDELKGDIKKDRQDA